RLHLANQVPKRTTIGCSSIIGSVFSGLPFFNYNINSSLISAFDLRKRFEASI
ncbi:MAG: hypothetical protein ACJAXX_002198, partial [Roseivirga sp.]